MNKYKEFLAKHSDAVIWSILFLCVTSVFLYNTRMQKVYDYRVIDGDTVTVFLEKWQGNLDTVQTIRFTDIECNEIKRTAKARQQAKQQNITAEEVVSIGKKSKQILSDLLAKHKNEIYFKGQILPHYDVWGRLLGTLYIGNKSVTTYMINQGKCSASD